MQKLKIYYSIDLKASGFFEVEN